ncbi:hypothetical protein FDECE_1959 [Fusarium decemcellulare]|nr:hypothetical protein FDECE_1959 [Fusarium decemcellulare]
MSHSIHRPLRSTALLKHAYQTSHLRYTLPSSRHYAKSANRRDADIIVVGAGIAGVSASIAAAEKGASVVLVDSAHGGGATAQSGGVVYAGGGTDQQKAAGYGHDTPENMFCYLKEETNGAVDDETLRAFCDGSVSRLKWLESHGAKFDASLCPYKTSYPTDQYYLYFSGNEKSHPFNKVAKPVPRGHRTAHPGFSGGALWRPLFDSAMKLGVRFLPASKVERLLLDDQGSPRGIEFKHLDPSSKDFRRHRALTSWGKKLQLTLPEAADVLLNRADRIWSKESRPSSLEAPAVILSAGGFAFNPDMRQQHAPDFSKVAPLGTRGDDGSGIRLGQSAGGSIDKMDNMSAWRFLYPPTALLEGVVVSQSGRRFSAEDVYGATLSDRMIRHHGSKAFLVLDSTQWAKTKNQLGKQTQAELFLQRLHSLVWEHMKAPSIESLANKIGVNAATLQETINTYNEAIYDGKEDPMKKEAEYCTPILTSPFYCLDISPKLKGVQTVHGLTLGGLRVDGKSGLVLRKDGTQIRGLYAAGRNAVGPLIAEALELEEMESKYAVGGLNPVPGFIVSGKGSTLVVMVPLSTMDRELGFAIGVRELCRKYNVLFISDDVRQGAGKTGKFLSSDWMGPKNRLDMATLGKSISGGAYPASYVLGTDEVMSLVQPYQSASTFAMAPQANAAVLATLGIMDEEKLVERALYVQAKWRETTSSWKYPFAKSIISLGGDMNVFIDESYEGVSASRISRLAY